MPSRRGRDTRDLPYRPLPFWLGIGAQIGPKRAVPSVPLTAISAPGTATPVSLGIRAAERVILRAIIDTSQEGSDFNGSLVSETPHQSSS